MVINYASILFLYFTIYYLRRQVYESDPNHSKVNFRFKQIPNQIHLFIKGFNIKETRLCLNYFSFTTNNNVQYLASSTNISLLSFITDPEITNNYKVVNPSYAVLG